MVPSVEIDPDAGFCSGVKLAVRKAEKELKDHKGLHCLGEFIHNEAENERLAAKGMKTIGKREFAEMGNSRALIRSHGEPPETYTKAVERNIKLVDATCPVVKNLQKKIGRIWQESKQNGTQIVIAGKKDHPEVIGLQGHTQDSAIIAESENDTDAINPAKPVELFAQTTFSREKYDGIIHRIGAAMKAHGNLENFRVHDTICGQVANRIPRIMAFCPAYDIVLFVAGKNSANGKALFAACLDANPNSYHIIAPSEINPAWIRGARRIGISGATSTPGWLMEEVRNAVIDITHESQTA